MKQAYNTSALEETTDFFDRVWEASVMKVENLKKHPHIASFIASVAVEPNAWIEKCQYFQKQMKNISHRLFCMSGIIKNSDTRRMQN